MAYVCPRVLRLCLCSLCAVSLVSCGGGGTGNPLPPPITVSVSPQSSTLTVGTSIQFTARVTGTPNTGVTWSINGIAGGSAELGLISSSGFYTVPSVPPSPNVMTVSAASIANPSRTGSASATIVNPAPTLTIVSPSSVNVGSGDTTLVLTGTGFAQQSAVKFGSTSLATDYGSPTQLTAALPSALLAATGTFSITVVNPTPGGGTAGPISFTVAQPPGIASASSTSFVTGNAEMFTVTATGFPKPTLIETGTLPDGITFNPTTGVLGGTPPAGTGGIYPITLTATNGITPDAIQDFTLTVNEPPALTDAASTTFTVGSQGAFTVTATGFPAPTFNETGALPGGVTFNTSTGVLSGTPGANTGGIYSITVTASNGVPPDTTQDFTLTVENPEPVLDRLEFHRPVGGLP
jgi:hypothetical protein